MVRIVGVNLPKEKNIHIALTYIFGIGITKSKQILKVVNISPTKKVSQLSDEEISKLISEIQRHRVEGDLRSETQFNVKRLVEINSYKGYRHRRRLPVNGQRTRTNARTRKGKKVTVANKKKETK